MDPAAIAPGISGADAVVSAIGPPGGRAPSTVGPDRARSIIQAMRAVGVRRLVAISGSMVDDAGDGPFFRYVGKPLIRRLLRGTYLDMRHAEAEIHESGLLWTILRAPYLTDRPARGRYRTAIDRNVPRELSLTSPPARSPSSTTRRRCAGTCSSLAEWPRSALTVRRTEESRSGVHPGRSSVAEAPDRRAKSRRLATSGRVLVTSLFDMATSTTTAYVTLYVGSSGLLLARSGRPCATLSWLLGGRRTHRLGPPVLPGSVADAWRQPARRAEPDYCRALASASTMRRACAPSSSRSGLKSATLAPTSASEASGGRASATKLCQSSPRGCG
jgi:hypothetical protein